MIIQELIKIKIGASKKERDPNWKTLAAKGTSGASGAHKNLKKDLELGKEKHKKKFIEALDEYDLYECACENESKKEIKPKFEPVPSNKFLTDVILDTKKVGSIRKVDDGKTGGYEARINNKKRWVKTLANAKKVILASLHNDESMLPPGTRMPS